MPSLQRVALVATLVVAIVGGPGRDAGAQPAPLQAPASAPDLPGLQAELAATTARARALADDLVEAAAHDGGLRVRVDRLAREHEQARARLDARVRQVYMRTAWTSAGHGAVPDWVRGLAAPDLERLAARGAAAAVQVDRALLDGVAAQSAQVQELQAEAEAFRGQLRAQAADVLAAQDRARALLAEAERLLAEQAAAERAAASEQATARQAAAQQGAAARADERARLAAARTTLDDVSASVTRTLTPAQTRRSRGAQLAEAPLLALAEAAGSGYPVGFAPTGTVLSGLASWYGPGFVGSPTASGAPYDPERLSCAHKALPLGTLVRVSSGSRAVTCLVNDRGPYVEPRILDMSRAGSRALGYDGVAPVVVEVLARTG